MLAKLRELDRKPGLYEPGSANMWTDPHLRQGMLDAHLDETNDAASLRKETRAALIGFVDTLWPTTEFPHVLDLGCGPGLIAAELARRGRQVTGVDFSASSLVFARALAEWEKLPIRYIEGDYVTVDFCDGVFMYDLAIMISYDFTVLSPEARAILLSKVYQALRPGGALLLDVVTTGSGRPRIEGTRFETGNGGYWSRGDYLRVERDWCYADETYCQQYILLDAQYGARCFHVWEHLFTPDELSRDMMNAGFNSVERYGDHAGAAYKPGGERLIAAARK